MAKPTRFDPKQTPQGTWQLNIPPKYSQSGKRERHYFKTREIAKAAAAKLKGQREEFGSNAVAIAPHLAEQATAAARLLEPYGASILDVVADFIRREEKARASVPVAEAVEAYRTANPHWSDAYARANRQRGDKLALAFPARILASITGEELHEHIVTSTNGATSHNQAVRVLGAFFRWCAKPPRGWCDGEAVKHLAKLPEDTGEIGILTAKEARALLAAAEEHFPECVAPFAISLFTGMRQAELERLRPSDITSEGITVPAISSKTKRRRFIALPDPLADWLAAHPIGEDVCPPNWQRKEKAVRRLAGWKVWTDLVDPAEPPADLPAWPANALRHTAATVAVALGKPLESLIFEHGHSGGVALLKRHYLGVMPKREAAAIWAIRPHGENASGLEAVA